MLHRADLGKCLLNELKKDKDKKHCRPGDVSKTEHVIILCIL